MEPGDPGADLWDANWCLAAARRALERHHQGEISAEEAWSNIQDLPSLRAPQPTMPMDDAADRRRWRKWLQDMMFKYLALLLRVTMPVEDWVVSAKYTEEQVQERWEQVEELRENFIATITRYLHHMMTDLRTTIADSVPEDMVLQSRLVTAQFNSTRDLIRVLRCPQRPAVTTRL